MGWREVYVLVAAGDEKGFPDNPVLGEAPRDAAIDAAALADLLARNEATVIDLSLSREYLSAHIPGAGSRSARGSSGSSSRSRCGGTSC